MILWGLRVGKRLRQRRYRLRRVRSRIRRDRYRRTRLGLEPCLVRRVHTHPLPGPAASETP